MKSDRPILLAGAAIALAALAAYHNSFGVPFLFDDDPSIVYNKTIQHLWPLSGPLSPPGDAGQTVSGRPLVNLTLAVNYAISGLRVWSYHAVNLLIHVLAGLTLFGVARRTLLLLNVGASLADARGRPPSFAKTSEGRRGTPLQENVGLPLVGRPDAEARRQAYGRPQGTPLQEDPTLAAFAVALLWTLHPLQTESVTYIVQRAESLMGLFYLLTLYCFVRAVDSPQPVRWWVASIAACFLGAGCKEVIVTAPLVVLLFDRTFVAGSFRGAWEKRHWYYGGLLATWPLLLWLVLGTGGNRGGTFALNPEAFGYYWLTQFEAVTRYLQRSFWPAPLVFDYGRFQAGNLAMTMPQVLLVGGLLVATGWALWKRPAAGFLGAAFFLILAPTSLMPGVTQVMAEHRMYLSLSALLALVVGWVAMRLGRRALFVFLALAFGGGLVAERRNADYQTALGLWRDTLQKRPGSAVAQGNVGTMLYRGGQVAEAVPYFVESLRLDPTLPLVHFNLGLAYDKLRRPAEALPHFAEAVRLLPSFAQAHAMLGAGLLRQGQAREAEEHFRVALSTMPAMPEIQFFAGVALAETDRGPEAIARFTEALRQQPAYAEAEEELGMVLFRMNAPAEALPHLERAVQLKPGLVPARYDLAVVLAQAGQLDAARRQLEEAVRLAPDFTAAKEMLERMKAAPGKR